MGQKMTNIAKPIIKQSKDNREALDFFENILLPAEDEKTQEIIANFPTVYIHNWQDSGDFEVYVGESNDIFKRTRQHYDCLLYTSNRRAFQGDCIHIRDGFEMSELMSELVSESMSERRLKPLPIGFSDYIRTQSEYYYVDRYC